MLAVCETTNPDVEGTILQKYIPLWNDISTDTFWQNYTTGLEGLNWTIYAPLTVTIDPYDDIGAYLDRSVGAQSASDFYTRLNAVSDEARPAVPAVGVFGALVLAALLTATSFRKSK